MPFPNSQYHTKLTCLIAVLLLCCCSTNENKQDSPELNGLEKAETNSNYGSTFNDSIHPKEISIPHGTQVLPESYKSAVVQEFMNLDLDTVIFSACNDDQKTQEVSYKQDHHKLKRVELTDTSLMIGFTFIENCGSDFLCEVEHIDDSTINLIYHQYGQEGLCACCFGIEYWFKIYPENTFVPIPPLKRVQFNGQDLTELGL